MPCDPVGESSLLGIGAMVALGVVCLAMGVGMLTEMPEAGLLLPALLFAGFAVFLFGLTAQAIALRFVDALIQDPSAWVTPREVEPGQELSFALGFGLARSAKVQRVTATLREEEVSYGQRGSIKTSLCHEDEVVLLEEGQLWASARQRLQGSLQIPSGARPSLALSERRSGRSWSVTLTIKLERYPAWSLLAPLRVVRSEERGTRASSDYEREVEGWLPEFVQEALRNPSPYDEDQIRAIRRVAKRRRIS